MQISRFLFERLVELLELKLIADFTLTDAELTPIKAAFTPSLDLGMGGLSLFTSTASGPIQLREDSALRGVDAANGQYFVSASFPEGGENFNITEDDTNVTVYGWALGVNSNSVLYGTQKFDVPLLTNRASTVLFAPQPIFHLPNDMIR